jgi:hypothetical protein
VDGFKNYFHVSDEFWRMWMEAVVSIYDPSDPSIWNISDAGEV